MKKFLKILKGIGIILAVLVVCAAAVAARVWYENSFVRLTNYNIVSSKITSAEDGGKIAVIADYHNSDNYERIIKKTKKAAPDAIVIAGDFINMDDTDFTNADNLMKGLVEIAPVYFVSGNHERWLKYGEANFLDRMTALGAIDINNKAVKVQVKDGEISLYGFKDIMYADSDVRDYELNTQLQGVYDKMDAETRASTFNMLVFHRGNLLDYAAQYPFDLIVAGHLHGGQVNLPKVREYVVEEKTGSSKYIRGYYNVDGVKAIISGGLENNNEIKRFLNTPEVVVITFESIKK